MKRLLHGWFVAFGILVVSTTVQAEVSEGFRLSQTCAGCHGTAGASPGSTIPILGGQHAKYLADALRAYKTGEREFYVMNLIAQAFDDGQIGAISHWFSSQSWIDSATPNRASLAAIGEPIAGSKCAQCHGLDGRGGELGPRIAGQPVTYLNKVIREYKGGKRNNASAVLMMIVRDLSDGDIEALSHYYSRLR